MSRSHSEFPQNAGAPADLLWRRQHAQSGVKGTEPSNITTYIYVVVNAIRTPFQGDFLVRVVPRAEALGCFLFARRALGTRTRKCPNCSPGTSCLATIVLSLRDKNHSPIEAPHNQRSLPVGPCWMDI